MNNFSVIDFETLGKALQDFKFNQLHIHHTWKPAHSSFKGDNHLSLQESMRKFHIEVNGWDDIGQHLTLMPDGKWVTGRSFKKDPASIKGWNKGALAVEILGNFDIPGTGVYNSLGYDKLEGKQKDEILKIIQYFGKRFGYENIVFHREGPGVKKTCPGTSLNKDLLISQAKMTSEIDKDISPWAKEAIEWAIDNNLVNLINPKENINLERLLTILYRFSILNK